MLYRSALRDRRRIVVKIGSSSLLHRGTGRLDYHRIDKLARELSDLKNQGKDVILVSSGATAVGRQVMGKLEDGGELPMSYKQACAAVGQARLMMIYQKSFEDYNQVTAQVLMTKHSIKDPLSKYNLRNTFTELLNFGVIPIVNENDTVETYEYKLGDNDTLSAMVASLLHADLLVLLSDVDGLYTDNPRTNSDARFISYVERVDGDILQMGSSTTGSGVGTGGMATKLHAAMIATRSGCDMMIASSTHIHDLHEIIMGRNIGTLFCADPQEDFDLIDFIDELDEL